MLSKEENSRYSRHILLNEVGKDGQEKLKAASILVIGAGGLGCPCLQYLSAAGVGRIGIIDFDTVDETNLQRQVLYSTEDIGENKATKAKEKLQKLNPLISIQAYPEKLTTKNALDIFKSYDIIIDGTDNFSTRYLVNDACVLTNKPLVYGAIYKFEGQVSVFNYNNGPTYRCLFPEPPEAGSVPSCSEIGVLGVLPGIIGSMQANEALKIILSLGEPLSGILMIYNTLFNQFNTLNIERNEAEVKKVLDNKAGFVDYDYAAFCGTEDKPAFREIDVVEFDQKLDRGEDFQLIDVREPHEEPKLTSTEVLNIPMGELTQNIEKIARDKEVIIMCQHGYRSIQAIMRLQDSYDFDNLINLKGGIVQFENLKTPTNE